MLKKHRRFITLGIFLAIIACYVGGPSAKDFKVNDIWGRLSADLVTREEEARELKVGKIEIDGLEGGKADINNHYYHAKY